MVRKSAKAVYTDTQGEFEIAVWPNSLLTGDSEYRIVVPYMGISAAVTVPDTVTSTLEIILEATSQASPTLCKVYGYLYDLQGQALADTGIAFQLVSDTWIMSENKLIRKWPVTATTNSLGYFEINLYANADLSSSSAYSVRVPAKGIYKLVTVPQQASIEFDNLCA